MHWLVCYMRLFKLSCQHASCQLYPFASRWKKLLYTEEFEHLICQQWWSVAITGRIWCSKARLLILLYPLKGMYH
jgi:hypothetical protein